MSSSGGPSGPGDSAASTPLSELTTLRVGGPAARLIRPADRQQLIDAVLAAIDSEERWLVLGGGSNVVAPDGGFDGTVIVTEALRGIESVAADDGLAHLRIGAGEPWDEVVAFAVAQGLAGIESLSGIPGSTGAAPVQNIGAYGQELSDVLHAVELLDATTGEVGWVAAAELGLGYRTSALKRGRDGVVLAVEIALRPGGRGPVHYGQLADALGIVAGQTSAIGRTRNAVLELRRGKGMLAGGDELPSAGSFFLNPIVDENWARSLPADAPRWPVGPEEADVAAPLDEGPRLRAYPNRRDVKLSAAWLIEQAGIRKGYQLPGSRAAISPKHTLAIVNTGGATAREVVQLAEFVQARVSAEFGINLQPEPLVL